MTNKQKEILLLAVEKHYKIDDKGFVTRFGKDIKGSVQNRGYLKFNIRNDRFETHPVPFHRLQAYQKYGDKIFEDGIVVRHLDGDRLNNSYKNILIGTPSDNQMDIPKETRIKSAITASRKRQNKIRTFEERCLIYEDLKNGVSYNIISVERNVSKSTLSDMKNKSLEYKEWLKIGLMESLKG